MAAIALACIILSLVLGVWSSLSFVWQWIIGPITPGVELILLAVILAFGAKLWFYLRRLVPAPRFGWHWLSVLFVLGSVHATYWLLRNITKIYPQGAWDAWAIWNLHARFLYRGGTGSWRDYLSNSLSWSHPDYPLLLPGLVAGFWRIVGSEYSWVPAALASLFAALSIAIMCSSVSALTKDNRGWLFGLVLLATPVYLIQPAYQMADLPLGVYFLATVVLLQFANALPQIKKHLLILAGLSAGLAGWTKDEGLLFIVVLLVLFTLTFAISRSWRAFFHHTYFFGAGLGPVLVVIISFKIFLVRPDTMFRGQSYIELLTDPQRYAQIAAAFLDQTFHFGLATINPILLVAFCLVLYGVPIESVRITRFSFSLLLLTPVMLVGYFMVYAISPYDLSWHLSSSLDRLFLQLWPMFVFSLAMISVPWANAESFTSPATR